jgi:hypothetical protein
MKAVGSSETLVPIFQTIWRRFPEESQKQSPYKRNIAKFEVLTVVTRRLPSSGMWRHVIWQMFTNVSVESIATILRIGEYSDRYISEDSNIREELILQVKDKLVFLLK